MVNPLPNQVAMLPESELNPKRNVFNDDNFPSEEGSKPKSELRFTVKDDKLSKLPKDDGSEPVRLLNGSLSEAKELS